MPYQNPGSVLISQNLIPLSAVIVLGKNVLKNRVVLQLLEWKAYLSSFFQNQDQGAVSRKPRKLFGPEKSLQNLEPCEYSAVLVTYSKDKGRFPSYKK